MALAQPVVVLGGGGFIGANLVRRLVADGHDVAAVDVAFPEYRAEALAGARRWSIDLSSSVAARAVVKQAGTVFHLAADMGGVGYFHSDADLGAAMANGLVTANVLAACAAEATPVFYASSACAYPIEWQTAKGSAFKLQESKVGFGTPDALYGAEKLHGLRLCSKIPTARVGILHTVYGPLQEHEGRRMKFPAAVATKALAARTTGTLELWGDGSQLRSYLFVDDAIDRILAIMEARRYEGPVNVGASGAVSCLDVAQMCLTLAGVPDAAITFNDAEPSGVMARDCSNLAYAERYGHRCDVPLADGFAAFMAWLDSL